MAEVSGRFGLARILFANPRDGWIWRGAVWVTHDGGATWSHANPPGWTADWHIEDVAVSGESALLLGGGAPAGPEAGSLQVFDSSVTDTDWKELPQPETAGIQGHLIASGADVWVLREVQTDVDVSSRLFTSADGGATWTERTLPCTGGGPIAVHDHVGLLVCGGGVAAGSQEKQAFLSRDNGDSFDRLADPPLGGDLWGVALRDAETPFVVAISGATTLYGSSDAGGTWSTLFSTAEGFDVRDLRFSSETNGAFVLGDPGTAQMPPSRLMVTSDGGSSWHVLPVLIPGTQVHDALAVRAVPDPVLSSRPNAMTREQ